MSAFSLVWPRFALTILCLTVLCGCGLGELGREKYTFQPEIPLPEFYERTVSERGNRGDLSWDAHVFELQVPWSEWEKKLDDHLVGKYGWTKTPHGNGFLYRSKTKEVMFIKSHGLRNDIETVRAVKDGSADKNNVFEMRIGILTEGDSLPEKPITIGI